METAWGAWTPSAIGRDVAGDISEYGTKRLAWKAAGYGAGAAAAYEAYEYLTPDEQKASGMARRVSPEEARRIRAKIKKQRQSNK
jgi:hypothetical protein